MERKNEARANMADTRHVLERGLVGDVLDLHVALALYVVGNALIGRNLAADPKTELESNSYADWIAMYAGESPKM